MNQKQDNLITVLDAGSTKSCVLVAELQDGVLRYRGHGIEPSRGMRKGLDCGAGAGGGGDQSCGADGGAHGEGRD